MGRGKKPQQLDRGCALPGNRGKEAHYRCPSESYDSLQLRTRSTVLGGATSHD